MIRRTGDIMTDSILLDGASPLFHDYGARKRFRGVVTTVKCFEDNSRVKELLAEDGRGKVLVVDAGGSSRCAILGDMIAEDAVRNGWEGIVVYGYVRDSVALSRLDIGVKALGVVPRKSVRRGEGAAHLRVSFAGVHFDDGDMLFSDEDGVIVLTREQAADLVHASSNGNEV
jgi:regulator of ribonuclease activity A